MKLSCVSWIYGCHRTLDRWQLEFLFSNSGLSLLLYPTSRGCFICKVKGHNWVLGPDQSLKSIIRDNATEMVAGMKRLRVGLDSMSPGTFGDVDGFILRYMAHVTNLTVKEGMAHVHEKICAVRNLVVTMRWSVKRRDLFEMVNKELNIMCELRNLDTETRWFSVFVLTSRAFKDRRVLNYVVKHM